MINLLYVVLIAMLAINISSDVLEGYGRMNNDYLPQIKKLEEYNRTLLERINSRNDKAALSAQNIDAAAGKLMDTLEELKEDIAWKADKEKYEAGKLKAKDDLNAVPEVFLSVTGGKGGEINVVIPAAVFDGREVQPDQMINISGSLDKKSAPAVVRVTHLQK